MQEKIAKRKGRASSRILEKPNHHLTISDGKTMNAGCLEDWLEGMQMRQNVQQLMDDWVRANSQLGSDCQQWVKVNSEWVREIAIRFNTEPRSLAIFVVVTDRSAINIAKRRTVADLGLIIGGIYGVRSEARIVGERPDNCVFVCS